MKTIYASSSKKTKNKPSAPKSIDLEFYINEENINI
jgi:hypothetical protein